MDKYINNQAKMLVGITEKDYLDWCKENNKPSYKTSSKAEFFKRIRNMQLVRDHMTGKLVKKHRPKHMPKWRG